MVFYGQARGKSPAKSTPKKTTPKKNGMNNLMVSEDILTPQVPNLRLEAKLTAEVSDCLSIILISPLNFLEVLIRFLFTITLWIACISSLLANSFIPPPLFGVD